MIGETYELATPAGRAHLRLSGTSSFGADNATLGAVLMQMNTAQAGELFGVDGINSVAVSSSEGADASAVQSAVATSVASHVPTAEVVDHATVLDETTSEFTDEINIVRQHLARLRRRCPVRVDLHHLQHVRRSCLSQRTRELALLRTVGADPKQIRRSVVGEALVIGVLASTGGIGGGIARRQGHRRPVRAMGVDLSD